MTNSGDDRIEDLATSDSRSSDKRTVEWGLGGNGNEEEEEDVASKT